MHWLINNPYFEQMVSQIYPTKLQIIKANSSDTEAPFLDLVNPITVSNFAFLFNCTPVGRTSDSMTVQT